MSEYLAVGDASRLVSDRRLLPDSSDVFQALQDITLTLSDDGTPGTLIPGTVLRSGPRELNPDHTAPCETVLLSDSYVHLLEVSIDRSETGYTRNWTGFNRRRWDRNSDRFERFVEGATGFGHESELDFLRLVAKEIWNSPFENYSRFTGRRIPYKTADETLPEHNRRTRGNLL